MQGNAKGIIKWNIYWLIGLMLLIYVFSRLVSGLSVSRALIHPVTIVYVLTCYLVVIFMAQKQKDLWCLIKLILLSKGTTTSEEIDTAKSTIDMLEKATYYIALTGFVIGLVALLNHLDTPSMIGPNIAMSLLSLFYCAAFLLIFVIPGKAIIGQRSKGITWR